MPYDSSDALLALRDNQSASICDVARTNEIALHGEDALDTRLDLIWAGMADCVHAGLYADGILPGGECCGDRDGTPPRSDL